ncbi:MAG: response regulator [Beijerinckiaceae bacterium]|jgi:DNA-binding response OmpR family regulator|nr:response regulator [Beijerinckiaceae bacterium]
MPESPHILVVDDDEAVRELLRDCLELDGFRVSEAADSRAMAAVLAGGSIDLVTLDLMLGGENGLMLARQIRASHEMPIVMISGKGDTIDKVVGLELGADDYITKPFHPREVVARIRAVLRRQQPAQARPNGPAPVVEALAHPASVAAPASARPGNRVTFAGWTLDLASRELTGPDSTVLDLTTAEFNLLEALVLRPQRVLSRDTIMDVLKGHDWTPFDRSIDAMVSRLRRKIEPDPAAPRLVKTVRGVGYMLSCPVEPA